MPEQTQITGTQRELQIMVVRLEQDSEGDFMVKIDKEILPFFQKMMVRSASRDTFIKFEIVKK
jgi:hypothetical protein